MADGDEHEPLLLNPSHIPIIRRGRR